MTLSLVRKYARKARDYMRVYRVGLDKQDGETDKHVRICKAHRCALDTNLQFITADEGDQSGVLVPVVSLSPVSTTTISSSSVKPQSHPHPTKRRRVVEEVTASAAEMTASTESAPTNVKKSRDVVDLTTTEVGAVRYPPTGCPRWQFICPIDKRQAVAARVVNADIENDGDMDEHSRSGSRAHFFVGALGRFASQTPLSSCNINRYGSLLMERFTDVCILDTLIASEIACTDIPVSREGSYMRSTEVRKISDGFCSLFIQVQEVGIG